MLLRNSPFAGEVRLTVLRARWTCRASVWSVVKEQLSAQWARWTWWMRRASAWSVVEEAVVGLKNKCHLAGETISYKVVRVLIVLRSYSR